MEPEASLTAMRAPAPASYSFDAWIHLGPPRGWADLGQVPLWHVLVACLEEGELTCMEHRLPFPQADCRASQDWGERNVTSQQQEVASFPSPLRFGLHWAFCLCLAHTVLPTAQHTPQTLPDPHLPPCLACRVCACLPVYIHVRVRGHHCVSQLLLYLVFEAWSLAESRSHWSH